MYWLKMKISFNDSNVKAQIILSNNSPKGIKTVQFQPNQKKYGLENISWTDRVYL